MNCNLSIIIPTYKGSKVISRCLESIFSYPDFEPEVIVVDDNGFGSYDQIETEKTISDYINSKKIIYLPHKVNSNGSTARNTGFKHSSGKFIFYFDDDDILFPKTLIEMVSILEKSSDSVGCCYAGYIRDFGHDHTKTISTSIEGKVLFEFLMDKTSMYTSTVLFKRNTILTVDGWDTSFKRHQDIEMISRVLCVFMVLNCDGVVAKKVEEKRNYPKNAQVLQKQGEYLLNKIQPYIREKLNKHQLSSVFSHYYINWAKWYIAERKFKLFLYFSFKSHRPIYCAMASIRYIIGRKVRNK